MKEPERWRKLEFGNLKNEDADYRREEVKFAAISGLHLIRADQNLDADFDRERWIERFRIAYCISSGHIGEDDAQLVMGMMAAEIGDAKADGTEFFAALKKARIGRMQKAETDWQRFIDNEKVAPNPFGMRL